MGHRGGPPRPREVQLGSAYKAAQKWERDGGTCSCTSSTGKADKKQNGAVGGAGRNGRAAGWTSLPGCRSRGRLLSTGCTHRKIWCPPQVCMEADRLIKLSASVGKRLGSDQGHSSLPRRVGCRARLPGPLLPGPPAARAELTACEATRGGGIVRCKRQEAVERGCSTWEAAHPPRAGLPSSGSGLSTSPPLLSAPLPPQAHHQWRCALGGSRAGSSITLRLPTAHSHPAAHARVVDATRARLQR